MGWKRKRHPQAAPTPEGYDPALPGCVDCQVLRLARLPQGPDPITALARIMLQRVRQGKLVELDPDPTWGSWLDVPDEQLYSEVRSEMRGRGVITVRCDHCFTIYRLSWNPGTGREDWEILQGQIAYWNRPPLYSTQ